MTLNTYPLLIQSLQNFVFITSMVFILAILVLIKFVELSCLICIKFLLLLATRNVRVQVKIVANATLSLAPYSTWAVGMYSILELHNYILVNWLIPLIFLQISEHCLFEEQLEILEASINYTYKSTAVSAEDNPSILSGKAAHGGVALFWKNCINDMVTPLENIDSDRIVGYVAILMITVLFLFLVFICPPLAILLRSLMNT